MKRIVITSGARTPVGAYLGGLKTVAVQDLAAAAVREAICRSGINDPSVVDDVILGHVESSGEAPNLGRIVAILSDMDHVPGYTVNRICGSGIQATANAWMQIVTGHSQIVVAGGAESLSRAPYYLPLESRYEALRMGNKTLLDANTTYQCNAQPYEMFHLNHMANTAENVVRKCNIPREDSDRFAYESQMKAKAAVERGRFAKEIIPISVTDKKGNITIVDKDEHPRPTTTLEGLAGLKAVFEQNGTITAGNASGQNDGASALIVMDADIAEKMSIPPMAEILDFAVAGLDPAYMGLGPVYAIRKLLNQVGLRKEDIDIYEINEAFAGQVLGCLRELDMYFDSPLYSRVNPNGGAVALGHPLGATGGRLILTAVYELMEQNKEYAIASACIGGGMGIAMLIRNCSK